MNKSNEEEQSSMENIKAVVCEYLGDVTIQEFDEYFQEEAHNIAALLARCNIDFLELNNKFSIFINASRSYHVFGTSLLAIGTYKKLRPNASHKEKLGIYFAAWISEWLGSLLLAVNDICDGKSRRASQPTIPVQLGSTNTMCLSIIINNIIPDMIEDKFGQEAFLNKLHNIWRRYGNIIMAAYLLDNSCVKYDRRRDPKWHREREYTSVTAPCFMLPVEVAFCLAQVPLESELGGASLKLCHSAGTFFRTLDDGVDLESDTLAGRLNWVFWASWRKANEEQQRILLECNTGTTKDEKSLYRLLELYEELSMREENHKCTNQKLQNFTKLLETNSDSVPKATWKRILEFYQFLYGNVGGSTFRDDE